MSDPVQVLVTGGSGQLGTELRRLAPAHWRIAAPPRAELDLARPEAMAAAVAASDWSLVINAGAYTTVDRAEDEPAAAWAANALGPAALAQAAARADVPMVQVSTDYVFDGRKPAPYDEDDPIAPLGVYGASKAGGELAVRAAHPRSVVLRTAWVVSPHGTNFIKTMFRLAGELPALRVVADQHGSPTSAGDLARAAIAVGERLMADAAAPTGVYHFVNAGEASWRELALEAFAARAAHGLAAPEVEAITAADYPTHAKRPANSRLATSKLQRDFGVTPRPWQAAIREVVDALLTRAPQAV